MPNLTDNALADKISFARSMGASSAWAELLRRFDYKQRQQLANLLAHSWTIKQIVLEPCFGTSEEVLDAKVAKDTVKLPARGEEDPKIKELKDSEKTIAALLADNNKLRIQADVVASDSKLIKEEMLILMNFLEKALSEPNHEMQESLRKITEFKDMYLIE